MKKKTKIVATISDIRCDTEFIESLYKNGMNVARLNTAHQSLDGTLKVIKNIRSVSNKIPILIDTKGPEIRTSPEQELLEVKKGEEVYIAQKKIQKEDKKTIIPNYRNFVKEVPAKTKILIDDGEIELLVTKKTNDYLICKVKNNGVIKAKKSINIPSARINLPSLSEKDKEYLDFAIKNEIDFIAHSFVRNKKDLEEIYKYLGKNKDKIKIISKIENQEGVDKIDEILDNCYGVMIARGDLGIEIPAEKVPGVQSKIIKKCIARKKPVITATQMLHTMIKNPRPTRAEVADIASAVNLGTDALMLSGETAHGDYPTESIKIMSKIALETENNKYSFNSIPIATINNEVSAFLAKSAVRASLNLPIKAIIADTMTGKTARYLAAYRGKTPIFAQCYDEKIMRALALTYGVFPSLIKKKNDTEAFTNEVINKLLDKKRIKQEDLILILAGNFGPTNGASFLEIGKVKDLVAKKK